MYKIIYLFFGISCVDQSKGSYPLSQGIMDWFCRGGNWVFYYWTSSKVSWIGSKLVSSLVDWFKVIM